MRQESCYDTETDEILIPFKDSNLLYNDLFQSCVLKVFYRNISDSRHYLAANIDKTENFLGPSRIDVVIVYEDKNPEAEDFHVIRSDHVELSPEQVKSCSKSEKKSLTSTPLTVTLVVMFIIIIIIVSLTVFFIRRKKAKETKKKNTEYDAYYKKNPESNYYETYDIYSYYTTS